MRVFALASDQMSYLTSKNRPKKDFSALENAKNADKPRFLVSQAA
jgi:hypothetical protein